MSGARGRSAGVGGEVSPNGEGHRTRQSPKRPRREPRSSGGAGQGCAGVSSASRGRRGSGRPEQIFTRTRGRSVGKRYRARQSRGRKEVPPAEAAIGARARLPSSGDSINNSAVPRDPLLRSLFFSLNFPDEGSNSRSNGTDLAGDQLY